MRSFAFILVGALVAVLAGGCRTMTPPTNFVPVQYEDMDGYRVRVVSADGVVVGLRTQDAQTEGSLDFWSQALTSELTGSKGYKLVSSQEATSSGGLKCRLMEFTAGLSGNTMTYMVALYVDRGDVLLAEAGGRSQYFQNHREAIRQSLLSMH